MFSKYNDVAKPCLIITILMYEELSATTEISLMSLGEILEGYLD